MTKAKYPIHHKPTAAFKKRFAQTLDQEFVVTDLEFIQWTSKRWAANWNLRKKGETFTAEFSLGGAEPSLEAIEGRLIKFFKPEKVVE